MGILKRRRFWIFAALIFLVLLTERTLDATTNPTHLYERLPVWEIPLLAGAPGYDVVRHLGPFAFLEVGGHGVPGEIP